MPPLIEEDEYLLAKQFLEGDGSEVKNFLESKFSEGKMEEPFRRLYEAAQMKVLANSEFQKAKEEILQHIKRNKVPHRKVHLGLKLGNDHSKSEITVKSSTLSTTNTFCNTEIQRAESCLKEGKRIGKNKPIGVDMNEVRKRSVSIIKSHYEAE